MINYPRKQQESRTCAREPCTVSEFGRAAANDRMPGQSGPSLIFHRKPRNLETLVRSGHLLLR